MDSNTSAIIRDLQRRIRDLEQSSRLARSRPMIPATAAPKLPAPQYQDMVYQGVSQEQGGFDWVHTHAIEG